jgi:hypothetical protein
MTMKGEWRGERFGVETSLDPTLAVRGERELGGDVELVDGRRINNEGTSGAHLMVVVRDGAAREVGESTLFQAGQVGLLEANNVLGLDGVEKEIVDALVAFA